MEASRKLRGSRFAAHAYRRLTENIYYFVDMPPREEASGTETFKHHTDRHRSYKIVIRASTAIYPLAGIASRGSLCALEHADLAFLPKNDFLLFVDLLLQFSDFRVGH